MRCCLRAAAGHSVAPVSYRIVRGFVHPSTVQPSIVQDSAVYISADQYRVQLQGKVQYSVVK